MRTDQHSPANPATLNHSGLFVGFLSAFWMVAESVLAALFATSTSIGVLIGGVGLAFSELGRFHVLVQPVIVIFVVWAVLAEVSFLRRLWKCFRSRLFPLPLQIAISPLFWPRSIRVAFGSWWLLRSMVGFCGVVVLSANTKANSTLESLILFLVGAGWMHMTLGYLLAAFSAYGVPANTVRKVWWKRSWLDVASGLLAVALRAIIP
jgi:hypothetical protein